MLNMKKQIILFAVCLLAVCGLTGCGILSDEVAETTALPEVSASSAETEPETKPEHSELYIPGVPVEDVITYFNEVCLDSEYSDSGEPNLVQKWDTKVLYALDGSYTDEDVAAIDKMADILNGIEGYPGLFRTDDPFEADLTISFYSEAELATEMGEYVNGDSCDGIVHYWYESNIIYLEVIGIRNDMSQHLRNSVILEEIYNGTGATQDTMLRPDSIIYQEYSEAQDLTDIDLLLLRLLYHPSIECGMNAEQCEAVIRELYY